MRLPASNNLFSVLRAGFPTDLSACAVETDTGLFYSWQDLEDATAMVANFLESLQCPKGSRIAVQVEKSVEALILYLATLRAGLVYLPLMLPSLVAIGTYALLLAWNEYLYAFLLLSNDRDVTLGVALGSFLAADDSPWELLMTTGLIYALPPAAIYYTFKRYMVGGLTAGAVKS